MIQVVQLGRWLSESDKTILWADPMCEIKWLCRILTVERKSVLCRSVDRFRSSELRQPSRRRRVIGTSGSSWECSAARCVLCLRWDSPKWIYVSDLLHSCHVKAAAGKGADSSDWWIRLDLPSKLWFTPLRENALFQSRVYKYCEQTEFGKWI